MHFYASGRADCAGVVFGAFCVCVCARFAPLVGDSFILYTDDGAGRATCDPNYFNYTRPLWPMAADPHGDGATAVPWAPTAASPAEARL